MFGLFKKKYWYYFYLPAEFAHHLLELTNDELKKNLINKNVKFERINIQKVSEYLDHISISFNTNKDLSDFKNYISKFKELFPPWVVFPDLFQGAPRWNQGYEQDYSINYWIPFWLSLNIQEKEDYLIKYNCPLEWKEWLEVNLLDS